MGDRPLEPLSLLVLDTTLCVPALDTDTDPVDRFRSAEHAHVVPDVPPTPQGQSAKRAGGEKRLVKGTFPHVTPVVSRRPLTRPLQRHFAAGCDESGRPQSGSSSCPRARRHHPHRQPVAPPDALSVGQRLVHRSAAALPQATVGSGGNHPRLPPSKSLTPFTHCWAHWRGGPGHRMEKVTGRSHQEG